MKLPGSLSRKTMRFALPLMAASALAGGACIVRPVLAQDTKAADMTEYTLKKRVFKSGEVNRYKLSMKNQIPSPNGQQDLQINMLFKETTKDTKPSGEFTLLTEFESATANLGGTEQDVTSFLPTITVMRDKDGKITTKAEGGNEQANAQISTMFQQFATMGDNYLPKTPIKVGDKWKVTVISPGPAGGENKSDGEATLVGTEVVAGVKSLKLKVNGDMDNKQLEVKGHTDSTMNIDPDTGKILKLLAKMDGTMGGSKMTQQLEMTLMPASTEKKEEKTEVKKEDKK